jgi:hypothetical protein
VSIFDGTTLIGTAVAGPDGTWNLTAALSAGTHSITVTSTDVSGNSSTASAPTVILVTAVPPATPLTVPMNSLPSGPFVAPAHDAPTTLVTNLNPGSHSLSDDTAAAPVWSPITFHAADASNTPVPLSRYTSASTNGTFPVAVIEVGWSHNVEGVIAARPIGTIDQVGAVSFVVPADAFAVPSSDTRVTLSATMAGGGPLPAWLSFDPKTGKFSGTPPAGAQPLQIKVVARDSHGHEATQLLELNVSRGRAAVRASNGAQRLAAAGKPGLMRQLHAANAGRHEALLAALRHPGTPI